MSEKQTLSTIKLNETLKPSNGHNDDVLRYDHLASDVERYARDHPERELWLEQSVPESVGELRAAQQVAAFYLLRSAEKLNNTITPKARDEWARHFTNGSIELYGAPDAATARYLERNPDSHERFAGAARSVGEYLEQKYSDVFAALDLQNAPREIAPTDITERFRAGIKVLARGFDSDWKDWRVIPEDGGDKLSASGQTETVTVGLNRADVAPDELKGLFAHEVLVHGLSAVNGYKRSKNLGDGLPGYLDFQEGLGGFVEYAVTGSIPEKIVDRYVDIAYALGQLDGREHTRNEMIVRNLARAEKRNESSAVKKDEVDIRKQAFAQANRIYRGSRGDKHVGVFTKDIAYYKGFVAVGEYIEEKLAEGHTAEAIFEYLSQGKFDPRSARHVALLGHPLEQEREVY